MSDSLEITITNAPVFKAHVRRLAEKYGLSAKDIMLDQMRLWITQLAKLTRPKKLSEGRKTIEKQLLAIFAPMKSAKALKLYRGIAEQKGTFPQYLFGLDPSEFPSFHQSRRNSRGRTRKSSTTYAVGPKTFSDKAHVKRADFNRYKREVQKRVGRMKAGWIPATKLFKAKMPSWVLRHVKASGDATDRMKKDGNGFLEGRNKTNYVSRHLTPDLVKITADTRTKDLTDKLELRLRGLARQFERAS